MKISVDQSKFMEGLQIVQKAVATQTALPVLAGILIEAKAKELILRATDLEMSIQHWTKAKILSPGKVVVPGKLLVDIIKSLPEGKVTIALDEAKLNIICEETTFTISSLPVEEFPSFPEVSEENIFKGSGRDLANSIKHVIKAVSRDETRPVLQGVLLKLSVKLGLELVATDSYRLAIKAAKGETLVKEDIQYIVPARTLDEVSHIVEDFEEVKITASENQIFFSTENTIIASRLIEGTFPVYEGLIPKKNKVLAYIKKDRLVSGLKRSILLSPSNFLVKLDLKKSELTLSAAKRAEGSVLDKVPARLEGGSEQVAFNAQYLLDGLQVLSTDEITLGVNGKDKPGIIKPAAQEDYIYLVMPVRVD
jgi:DNA polymerase-3 subunit beta